MLRLQRAVLLRARVPRLLPRVTRRHSTLDAPTWSLPLPEGVLGQVSELFCEPGSRVHMDETVAVIETDKLAIDVKASQSGVVSAVLVSVGDDVKVRQPLYALDVSVSLPHLGSEAHERERRWARAHEIRVEEERTQAERAWQEQKQQMRNARARGDIPQWQWHWQNSARAHQMRDQQHTQRTWGGRGGPRFQRSPPRAPPRAGSRLRPIGTHKVLQPKEVCDLSIDELIDRVLAANGSNPYASLGLPANAATSSVRKRYLALALRLHPDKAGQPRAREAFEAIDSAFRALKASR